MSNHEFYLDDHTHKGQANFSRDSRYRDNT